MPERQTSFADLPKLRPEVAAFLAAAKDEPEDDAPRLVLADWLEENGDSTDAARAEFARAARGDPRVADLLGPERLLEPGVLRDCCTLKDVKGAVSNTGYPCSLPASISCASVLDGSRSA